MINLTPQKTYTYYALQFEKQIPSWFFGSVTNILLVSAGGLAIVVILVWLEFSFPPLDIIPKVFGPYFQPLLGLLLLLSIIIFLLISWLAFLEWLEIPHPKRKLQDALPDIKSGKENVGNWLDFETFHVVFTTLKYFKEGGSAQFSLSLLWELAKSESSKFILMRLGINPEEFKKAVSAELKNRVTNKGKCLEEILSFTIDIAQERNKPYISTGDLFSALAKLDPFFYNYLFAKELDMEDVKNISYWQESIEAQGRERGKFWTYENLMRINGIGKSWAAGYTIGLDQFSQDITQNIEHQGFEIRLIGHNKEIKEIERILAASGRHNVLVVGEAGAGKETVVYGFAKMIYEGKSLSEIAHKRVLRLDVDLLLAGLKTAGEMSERIISVFNEAVKARNIILVIDNFDNFTGEAFGLGKIDITSTIEPYLGSKYLQVIGITDFDGFHRTIEQNAVIMKLFERVEVKEPSEKEAILILEDTVPALEARHGVFITYPTLRDAVKKAQLYIEDVAMPEKAIYLLEESAVYAAKQRGKKIVLPSDIDSVLTERTGIPMGKAVEKEKELLINLEEVLHRRLINQEEAVKSVAGAMRRARTGLTSKKRPIGSFLFMGPTGVGKTETAKALAEAYFGSETSMIRFDMSEYQDATAVNRFLGSSHLGLPGDLPTAVRDKPFSLILFDEIDKAYPKILDLFLQIIDEGFLTDAFGKKVNFRNAIIITTSNAGANLIRESVRTQVDLQKTKEKVLDFIQKQGVFKPELLNRFDGIIIYQPLLKTHLLKIAELMLGDLAQRLEENDVMLNITPKLQEIVVELGYKPEFGARPMRRVIQEKIEDMIAKKLLSGEIKRGDSVTINPEDLL